MTFLLHTKRIITKKKKKYSTQSTYHALLYMLDNLLVSQLPCFLLMTKGEKYMNWCYKHWCYDYAMPASSRDTWTDAIYRNATLAKIFEMCTSCNDIKILLHSFTCWYLTIWWIATITIIQTCNVKFENECQALTSSSVRYIMMRVLISLNDFNLSIYLLNSKVLNSRMTYLKYGI